MGPIARRLNPSEVDGEHAPPAPHLLGVRHLAGEPAGPPRERAEDQVHEPVRRRAHLGRRRRHDAAVGRLGRGRRISGRRPCGRLRCRRLRRREVRLAHELRLGRVLRRRLREDAEDVLGTLAAEGGEVERRIVLEGPRRRLVVAQHLELPAELHVVPHDEVHDAVRGPRRRDGHDGHLGQRRQPRGRPVHLDRPQDALVGLVRRRRLVGCCPRRRRHQEPKKADHRKTGRREEGFAENLPVFPPSCLLQSACHSQAALMVQLKPTGKEDRSMSGYIGGGAGSSAPLPWIFASVA